MNGFSHHCPSLVGKNDLLWRTQLKAYLDSKTVMLGCAIVAHCFFVSGCVGHFTQRPQWMSVQFFMMWEGELLCHIK